jgi:GNAT superfamily N-acetyltransferase
MGGPHIKFFRMKNHLYSRCVINSVSLDDPNLPFIIQGCVGNSCSSHMTKVIKGYESPDHEIIGAFIKDCLIGILGYSLSEVRPPQKHVRGRSIVIRHMSVMKDFQKKGIGTLLIDEIKKRYTGYDFIAETDAESVGFYRKNCFSCQETSSPYSTLRYRCLFYETFYTSQTKNLPPQKSKNEKENTRARKRLFFFLARRHKTSQHARELALGCACVSFCRAFPF